MGDKSDMYLWAAFIFGPEISKHPIQGMNSVYQIKIHTYSFQTSQHHSIASNGMQICFLLCRDSTWSRQSQSRTNTQAS